MERVFWGLCDNIEVEGLVAIGDAAIDSGAKVTSDKIQPGGSYSGKSCGDGGTVSATAAAGTWSPWIIAADGMAFTINSGGGCGNKGDINGPAKTAANAWSSACVAILVDTNGLEKLPNKIEPQTATLTSSAKLKKLTGDRFYIYMAKNGIAKGSELLTVTGRLVSGNK